jgi:hypothetical protein
LALREVSVRSTLCTFLLLCALALPVIAQESPTARSIQQRGNLAPPTTEEDDARARITSDMAKKAAKERIAALRVDTDRLLKLSVELKEYVDKSDENVLSLDVVRKAEQIEKLAKSVKDKMKGPN